MTKETYYKLWSLIVAYGDARFQKGVAPIDSDWEKESSEKGLSIFNEIREILFEEVKE